MENMREKRKQNKIGNQSERKSGVRVNIEININKIVRYLSIAGVMIVGIIFGTSLSKTYLEVGGSDAIALLFGKGKEIQ